jgi:hypothetical protein
MQLFVIICIREFGLNNCYGVTSGICKEEAVHLFKQFYSQENINGKQLHIFSQIIG